MVIYQAGKQNLPAQTVLVEAATRRDGTRLFVRSKSQVVLQGVSISNLAFCTLRRCSSTILAKMCIRTNVLYIFCVPKLLP